MNAILKAIKASFLSYFLLSYVILTAGFITNILQLLTLIIWPFDKILYRKINYYLNYLFYANYTFLAQYWSGTQCEMFIRKEDLKYISKENAIVVTNHKYDTDWLLGCILCQNFGLLAGAKGFFKNILKYLPILGWSWIFSGNVFVKRNWEEDVNTLENQIKSILDFPKGYNYTMVIFCEGTRFTESKHKMSLEIARTKGLPEMKHHLLPRPKGFTTMVRLGKGKFDAIYDCTFAVKNDKYGSKPGFAAILRGETLEAQMLIRRIPIDKVPDDNEQKCAEFLYNLYKEKDEIFDKFFETGDLSSVGIEKATIKRNKYDLYMFICWSLLLLPAFFNYVFKILWFGSIFLKVVFLIVMFLLHYLTKYLTENSMIEYTSSFGLNKKVKKQ